MPAAESHQLCFQFDAVITPQPDGSVRVSPGRMRRVRGTRLDLRGVMQRLPHLSRRTVQTIMARLNAGQCTPRGKRWLDAEELERFCQEHRLS